jgi:tetratricopeptide (TPR) repeat protein
LYLLPGYEPRRTEANGRVQYVFEQGPIPPHEDLDEFLPPENPRVPGFAFATGKSWQAVASRYSEQVEAQLRAADLKAFVAPALAGAKQREEIIRRLVRRLHEQIRYTGVEYGDAAYIPRSPAETLQRKYGDCKDKSALLIAMLRTAGMPAHLALLRTSPARDTDTELPGMGGFDHAIVYVPGTPAYWVDATDEYSRLGELPVESQGRLALIISPETRGMVKTPESTSAENRIVETREFFLADMGPARVVETTELFGSPESGYRGYYKESEAKETLEQIERYAKETYLAKEAPKFELSDTADFSKPFRLRMELAKASRGTTDLSEAVAAILQGEITSRLADALREEEKKEEDKTKEEKKKKPRTADWVLNETSVTEWRYRVVPPAGFRVKSFPENDKRQFGPASFSREFKEEPDGAVTGVLKFDIGPRRFTAAQGEEIRKGVVALHKEPALMITFAARGFALLEEGKTKEALTEFRKGAAANPKVAIHHLRTARGLLAAGLGNAARAEARIAAEADPKSSFAWQMLGWTLQHDELGRLRRKGFDRDGAIAAYRKAIEIDAENWEARGDLAILLEHDANGERYGKGAQLGSAITEYLGMKEKLAEFNIADNLGVAYLRAGKWKEGEEYVKTLPVTTNRRTIQLTATALGEGAGVAIVRASKEISDDSTRRTALRNVAATLIQMREYAKAAEILSVAARGAENAAQILGQAELFRKVKRYEELTFPENDPKAAVLKMFATIFAPDKASSKEFFALFSRVNDEDTKAPDAGEELENVFNSARQQMLRSGLSLAVARDVVLGNMPITQEGEERFGYRIRVQGGGRSMTVIVVREVDKYVVLDSLDNPTGAGREALARVERGDLEGARRLLDWVREDTPLGGGDDPYAGGVFARLWERGKPAPAEEIRVAAAALISGSKMNAKGVEVLLAARNKAESDAARTNLDVALAASYAKAERFAELLPVAERLLKSAPKSATAFSWVLQAQLDQKKWAEASNLIAGRQTLLPDDRLAVRALAELAESQGKMELALGHLKKLTESNRAEAGDWNNLAWDALFVQPLPEDALSNAQRAATLSGNNQSGILHTLGAVLAEAGKAAEARSVMLQVMESGDLDEPNGAVWYLFGRIAEEYGEKAEAIAAYRKVIKKKKSDEAPNSTYQLSRMRLAKLQGPGK